MRQGNEGNTAAVQTRACGKSTEETAETAFNRDAQDLRGQSCSSCLSLLNVVAACLSADRCLIAVVNVPHILVWVLFSESG